MDITKEKNPALVAPLDLYAEFARLCGAPKDMNLDEQIMLYEEYQRAIEVEMEDKFEEDTPEAECKKITDEFIQQWVAKKRAYFIKAKKENASEPPPPQAYAAFVRIYMDWLEKSESEQLKLVEQCVRTAKLNHTKLANTSNMLGNNGTFLYGAEFDEYVNEVWAKFLEKCNDINKFAEYLQEDFKSKPARWANSFVKECTQKWLADTKDMSLDEVDQYLNDEYNRCCAEYAKRFAEKEDTIRYPSLKALLCRPAQNMMSRLNNDARKRLPDVSIDAERENDGPSMLETLNVHNMTMEECLHLKEVAHKVEGMLNEEDKKIYDLKVRGCRTVDIANEVGKSISTVSKRWKKIKKLAEKIEAGII